MAGGLFDPLGTGPAPARRGRPRPSAAALAAAAAILAALFAVAALRDDGTRGRPVAVVPIGHAVVTPEPPAAPALLPPAAPAPPPPAAAAPLLAPPAAPPDDAEVEVQNGVRIIRPRRPPAAPGAPR